MADKEGKVVAVYGSVVDVQFKDQTLPVIYEVLKAATFSGEEIVLEVLEHHDPDIARCIALTPTYGLRRNSSCFATGKSLSVPTGDKLFGRVVNVLGKPIDGKGAIETNQTVPIRRNRAEARDIIGVEAGSKLKFEIMSTSHEGSAR